MKIEDIIKRRKIQEILHFTTNKGLTGIVASKAIIARKRLPKENYLEHILFYNCTSRIRDREWLDYVNLSITSINLHLFGISSGKWHPDIEGWWCILSFSPEILMHPGVYFCTTNNAYTCVERGLGAMGLEKLFADRIDREPEWAATRTGTTPINQPTCNQAEVLYPGKLSLDYLKHIYVQGEEHVWAAESICDMFTGLPEFDINIKPEMFS